MGDPFFEHPILNSPYAYPVRHGELDEQGQPTQRIVDSRRRAEFITPIAKPKKRRSAGQQASLIFDEGAVLSSEAQQYDHTATINAVRAEVDKWRVLPEAQWQVTPETVRLLRHWRMHKFAGIRPFFCQIEAVETAIWLTEVAPHSSTNGQRFVDHLANANAEQLRDIREATLLMHLPRHLLYCHWRDPGEKPKLHLFGQLKQITRQWLQTCLDYKGGRYPAQLMYQELADMACARITRGSIDAFEGKRPIQALLDPHSPAGPTAHVSFTTSKTDRWQTDPRRCHLNWLILDSDWEAEFCRVAQAHPKVLAYVNNHKLGRYGRWAFVEFTDVWTIQDEFSPQSARAFEAMIDQAVIRKSNGMKDPCSTRPRKT